MTAQLRLLGSFGLTDADGTHVPIASSRAQSLFACLALQGEGPQSRRQVSFLLWPDASEAQARNSLRQLIHQVRAAWPGAERYLVADASTLAIDPAARLRVDVDEYEHAVAKAVAADGHEEAPELRAAFERAADLYRGDLLPDAYDEWIAVRRERLVATHQRTLDRLIGLLERQGDYRAAIEYGQRRLRARPARRARVPLADAPPRAQPGPRGRPARLPGLRRGARGGARRRARRGDPPAPRPDRPPRTIARWRRRGTRRRPRMLRRMALDAGTAAARRPAARVGRRDRGLGARGRRRGGPPGHRRRGGHRQVAPGGRARGVDVGSRGAHVGHPRLGRRGSPVVCAGRRLAAQPRAGPGPAPARRGLAVRDLAPAARSCSTQRPDLPRPSARIEDWQRQAFFGSLVNAFVVVDRPQLLVLDDLQWCDADTLEWLHFLLRADRRSPLLVVGTVRSDEVDDAHPVRRLVAGLREEGRLTEIALGPLEPAETSTLAAQVAGRSLTPAQAIDLQRETEGNPLFVVETVRAGLVQPVRVRAIDAADDDVAGAAPPRAIAPKVQQVIAARLAQLSAPAQGPGLGRGDRRPGVHARRRGRRERARRGRGRRRARRAPPARRRPRAGRRRLRLRARQDPRGRLRDDDRRVAAPAAPPRRRVPRARARDGPRRRRGPDRRPVRQRRPGRPGRHVLPARRGGRAADRVEPPGDRAPQPGAGAARDPAAQRGARRPRARPAHGARGLARRHARLRLDRGVGRLHALPPAVPGAGTSAQPAGHARHGDDLARPGPDRRLPRPRRPPAQHRGARRRPGAPGRGVLRHRRLAGAQRRDAAGTGRARGLARLVRPLAIADPHRPLLAGPGRGVLDPPQPAAVDHGRAGGVRQAA